MDLNKALELVAQVFASQRVSRQEHQVLESALMVIKQALGDKLEKKE